MPDTVLLRGVERLVVVACVPLLILIGYQLFRMGVAGDMKITATLQKRWSASVTAVAPGSLCFLLGIGLGAYIMFSKVNVTTGAAGLVTYQGFANKEVGPVAPLSVRIGAALDGFFVCAKQNPASDAPCKAAYDKEFSIVPSLEDLAKISRIELAAAAGDGKAMQELNQLQLDYGR